MKLKDFLLKEELGAEVKKGAISRIVKVFGLDGRLIKQYSYADGKFAENKNAVPQVNLEAAKTTPEQINAIMREVQKAIDSGKYDGDDGKPDFTLKIQDRDVKISSIPD